MCSQVLKRLCEEKMICLIKLRGDDTQAMGILFLFQLKFVSILRCN